MPRTEIDAAVHGQSRSFGLPLRSLSAITLMPLVSTREAIASAGRAVTVMRRSSRARCGRRHATPFGRGQAARVDAMDLSDRWVESGCHPYDPLAQEREPL